MKIYLLMQGERETGEQKVHAYLFKHSAMTAARGILSNGGKWERVEDHETSATDFWVTSALWMSIVPLPIFFKDWTIRRWIRAHCHWQNLNEDKDGKIKGSILMYGRAWFHRRWSDDRKSRREIHLCWHFGKRAGIAAELDLFDGDSQRDVQLSCSFLFFSLYLTFADWLPKRFGYPRHSWHHTTGFYWKEDSFRVMLHHAGDDCWSCKGWKGRYGHWFISDVIWGRSKRTENVLSTGIYSLEMPERTYEVEVKLTEDTWTRPRKPWPTIGRYAECNIEGGIPTPGKGENSWDCGEDATYGLSCPATTAEEALAKLKESVMRQRERYGGKNWKPSLKAAV